MRSRALPAGANFPVPKRTRTLTMPLRSDLSFVSSSVVVVCRASACVGVVGGCGVGVGVGVGGTATGVPLTSTSETSMYGRGASWLSETGAIAVRRISRRPARSPLSGSVTYPRGSAAPTDA